MNRHRVLLGAFFVLAALYCFRLVQMQVNPDEKLVAAAQGFGASKIERIAPRGTILDRNGTPLAISSLTSSLRINTVQILEAINKAFNVNKKECEIDKGFLCDADLHEFQLHALQPLIEALKEEPELFLAKLNERRLRKDQDWHYFKRVEPEIVDEVLENLRKTGLVGVNRLDEYKRVYPTKELMAQVVGYLGEDRTAQNLKGREGAELFFESRLASSNGEIIAVRRNDGGDERILKVVQEIKPAIEGENIVLSVDARLQKMIHNILSDALFEFRAKSALSILVDVKTGEILAMVSLPTTNPNAEDRDIKLMQSAAIYDVFEPGSVIKPIVIAGALNDKVITPQTKFVTNGQYQIGRSRPITDVKNYGVLTTAGIVKKSSNIGMAMISERYPLKKFYEYMDAMGFGHRALHLTRAEAAGTLPNPEKRRVSKSDYARMSFGYALNATALQIVQAYATLANDGVKVPLSLEKVSTIPEGTRVIRKEVAREVQRMMLHVVADMDGTGGRARSANYTVMGKTGTSHKTLAGKKGYEAARYLSLFAGIAPTNNPRLALVVLIDDPDKTIAHFGGAVAAPQFGKIMDSALKTLGLTPDKIERTENIKFEIEDDQNASK